MNIRQRKGWSAKLLSGLLASIAVLGIVAAPVHAQTKLVIARYIVDNQDYSGSTDNATKVAAYEREIMEAKAAGIDGFALEPGSWSGEPFLITYTTQMFQAAAALNNGFKLCMAPSVLGSTANDMKDMVRRFANDPAYSGVYLLINGKVALAPFGPSDSWIPILNQVRADLATSNPVPPPSGFSQTISTPLQITLIPLVFWGGEVPVQADIQTEFNQWASTIDGAAYYGQAGIAGSGGSLDTITSSEAFANVVHSGGKLYAAPVTMQYWGANNSRYYEYSGYTGMRKFLMDAINVTHPEVLQLNYWNDFIGGDYFSPIDDPNKYPNANFLVSSGLPTWNQGVTPPTGYFHSHIGATNLLPYYLQWYKTGVQPTITKDSIYWAYRTLPMAFNASTPSVANKFGPLADSIYVTCHLTSAATLKVTSGSLVTNINVAAGISDVSAPFTAGNTPTFQLIRNAATVINATATDPIQSSGQFNNYYYSTGSATSSDTIPQAPTGLTLTRGNTTAVLNWTGVSGATTYNIYRSTSSGGEGNTPIANQSGTTFNDSGLSNTTQYYYKVAAVSAVGTGPMSMEVTSAPFITPVISIASGNSTQGAYVADADFSGGTVSGGTTHAIDTSAVTGPAPTSVYQHGRFGNVTYTIPGLVGGQAYSVRLHFCEYAHTAAGQRKFNVSINGTQVLTNFDIFAAAGAEFRANTQSFSVTANSSGQLVIAFATVLDNAIVNGIEVTTTSGTVPTAPTNLVAAGQDSAVQLSWTASSGTTPISYNLYRGTTQGGESATPLATGISGPFYLDTAIVNGTKYFYQVRAVNLIGTSSPSNEVNATPAPTSVPTPPTNLTAFANDSSAILTWQAGVGATSFNVYSSGVLVKSGINNSGTTTMTGLTNGQTYQFQVAGVNSVGTSTLSNVATVTPVAQFTGVDLVVTSITWTPASPASGNHVVFTATIKNQGDTATPGGTIVGVRFAMDGSTSVFTWNDKDTTSLGAGQSVTLTATGGTNNINYWTAASGTHTVQAWVDDVNRITESNESNNKLNATVSVP